MTDQYAIVQVTVGFNMLAFNRMYNQQMS